MTLVRSVVAVIVSLSIASSVMAQGHSGKNKSGHTDQKQKHVQKNERDKSKHSMKREIRWDVDRSWNDEYNRMRRDVRLNSNQGRRVREINRNAMEEIHRLQARGLRGQDLSTRIRAIRMDARRQIERVLNADQRRRWHWTDDAIVIRRKSGGG